MIASLHTIQQRLQERGDGPDSWSQRKATLCVPRLSNPIFAVHVDTEGRTTDEIVHQILAHI